MKTLIVIESAKELLRFASKVRAHGDDSPSLPANATLIFEDNMQSVRLQADGFAMEHIQMEDLIAVLVASVGLKVHIT